GARLPADPHRRADPGGGRARPGGRDPADRRADLRPPPVASRLHPAGQHREHQPGRAHGEVADVPRPERLGVVSIADITRAQQMAKSPTFPGQNASVVSLIEQILARGRAQGRFIREVEALDVHMLISSYCVFRVCNRHTFKTIFGRDLTDPALRDRYRAMLGDLVVAYLTELDDP